MAIVDNPAPILTQMAQLGLDVPQGASVNVVQNFPGEINIVFPISPPLVAAPPISASNAIPDSALGAISGGGDAHLASYAESFVNGVLTVAHDIIHEQMDELQTLLDAIHEAVPGLHPHTHE